MFGAQHIKAGIIEASRQFKAAVDGLDAGRDVGVNAAMRMKEAIDGLHAGQHLGEAASWKLVYCAAVVMCGVLLNTVLHWYLG